MKNFWPHRSKAKGFSIENLARRYRERISRVSSGKIPSQLSKDRNLISMKEESNKIGLADISIDRVHWANRDFSEYKKAA